MSVLGYWIGNLVSDLLAVYVPIFFMMLLNYAFSDTTTDGWVFLMLYPLAIVPFSYYTSFLFVDDTTAQISTLFFHFLTGCIFAFVSFVMQLIATTIPYGDPMRYAGLIFPNFCVIHAFLFSRDGAMLTNTREQLIEGDYPDLTPWPADPWDWANLKWDFVALSLHAVFGILLLAFIESPIADMISRGCCKDTPAARDDIDMDDDVLSEEQRIDKQVRGEPTFISSKDVHRDDNEAAVDQNYDVIRVNNFSKTYSRGCGETVRAVQGVSFGLDYGECFALLGVNGAGKSTTFKSLTRDIAPTTGEIHIQNFDVQENFTAARKLIGYCPQYDAIFPLMTVKEHLFFYAKIKGINGSRIRQAVEKALNDLSLWESRNKKAGTLSGGNKRKLMVAMAIIGNPPIILLDEPSAGMDP
jgi:ABC-type branched-subunit amino acid transport system ATPase component